MSVNNDIKVMVVDDSLSIRLFLRKILNATKGIKVVAVAEDPFEAMEQMKSHDIDVMTLDVEMPKMDGLTFLQKVMRLKPMPVVMVSTLTKKGSKTAIEALNYGAVDIVAKPSHKVEEMEESAREIIYKVIEAANAKVSKTMDRPKTVIPSSYEEQEKRLSIHEVMPKVNALYVGKPVISIASSTGGPQVLKEILSNLNLSTTPPIVIVQHISVGFSEALAKSIDAVTPLQVVHAQDGQLLKAGHVYLAPAGIHVGIVNDKNFYKIKFYDLPRVNRHKPSADVLFKTVNAVAGRNSLSFVLTGMGDDGAIGLKELCASGGKTYIQNEESCTVYGMPKSALKIEPSHPPLNVSQIIKKIKEYTK